MGMADSKFRFTGCGSLVGREAVCNYLLQIDPHVRHILSGRFGHENISTAILPLIQEEQLSINGERLYTQYW